MALLGTPPAINGIFPPRRKSKLFGGLRRETGNCGLPSRGLPPWFLGGTQQISRRVSPGKCFGGVGQSAEGRKLFVGSTQQMPRRLSPGICFGGAARSVGGYLSGTLRQNPKTVLRRIAPLRQNTSPAIIDGIFVGYPPETRAEGLAKEVRSFPFRGEVHRKASSFVVGGKSR